MDNYADIALPLSNLLGKAKFVWGEDQKVAFKKLKEALTKSPILTIADTNSPFRIQTDASKFAIGGVLLQKRETGRWHPVAFYSRKLGKAEKNYPVHEIELLALINAVKTWKHYLWGGFIAQTDH